MKQRTNSNDPRRDDAPSLAILIPTYGRARWLEALLRAIASDPAASSPSVSVLVSDNASTDHTASMLRSLESELDRVDLRIQIQPENLGPIPNMHWLIDAADADYVWLFGDDDEPAQGAIGYVQGLLADLRPTVLHLPHRFAPVNAPPYESPCPRKPETFESGRELLLEYHHWMSFMSATVVERGAMLEAVRDAPTLSPWAPHIWFGVAGRGRKCATAARRLVIGGGEISWRSSLTKYMTTRLIEAYDDGFNLVVNETEYATLLDARYRLSGAWEWDHAPFDELVAATRRFPASQWLRSKLAERAHHDHHTEALAVVAEAVAASGDDVIADEHVHEGERCFVENDLEGAVKAFRRAVSINPVHASGWCDLGVVLGQKRHNQAADAFDRALELDPEHLDARVNRAWWAVLRGLHYQAAHDARRALEIDPGNEDADKILAAIAGAELAPTGG